MLVAVFLVIWNARYSFIFEGKKENPQMIVAMAEVVMDAYQRVRKILRCLLLMPKL